MFGPGCSRLQEGIRVGVAQALIHGEIHIFGQLRLLQLLPDVQRHSELVATVDIDGPVGTLDDPRHTVHVPQLLLYSLDPIQAETIPSEVKRTHVGQLENDLEDDVHCIIVEAIVDETEHIDLLETLVTLEKAEHLLDLAHPEA
eukprot:Skav222495  [mRNA]  locus=scaffold1835:589583:604618:+ [translate_table: standard]